MRPPTPLGFYLSAILAACFGVAMAFTAALLELGTSNTGWTIAGRGAAALLAALSGVAAEALWRARPWARRASFALALTYAALVMLFCAFAGEPVVAFFILIPSAVVVVPVVGYVHLRSVQLFGLSRRPAGRRPRPVAAAAARRP